MQHWHIFVSRPPMGEGAYAVMIIIIKKILMCLVFVTQLLMAARRGGDEWVGDRAAKKWTVRGDCHCPPVWKFQGR